MVLRRYAGLENVVRVVLGATWIDDESLAYNTYHGGHSRSHRRGLVHCGDGKLHMVTLGIPDTYFTIPAHTRIQGKYVSGFVSVDRTNTNYGDDGEFVFTAYAKD